MAVAIEDAGFEVRDMIEWVYGSGFSKCTVWSEGAKRNSDRLNKENDLMVENGWQGWGRGGLKPAHEPICMARKPLAEKTVAENVLKYGTGGINIDECRVGETGARNNGNSNGTVGSNSIGVYGKAIKQDYNMGRFPANLIHDNSEEVRVCFPESKSAGKYKEDKLNTFKPDKAMFALGYQTNAYAGDSGNASRFFKSIIYQAKASKAERNRGCEGLYILKDNTPKEDIEEIKHLLSI
jgi:site-specific DNA-methyltransferase (adenine-specific)